MNDLQSVRPEYACCVLRAAKRVFTREKGEFRKIPLFFLASALCCRPILDFCAQQRVLVFSHHREAAASRPSHNATIYVAI